MLKRKLNKCIIVICIILMTLGVSGCSYQQTDEEKLKEKNIAELQYLDNYLLVMLNNMNNITLKEYDMIVEETNENVNEISKEDDDTTNNSAGYEIFSNMVLTNNKEFSWNTIKTQVERLNTSWPTILVDLQSANVNNNKLAEFSNTINTCVGFIKNEDKINTMQTLARLYELIPEFMQLIEEDENSIAIAKTKKDVIYAYINIELDKWDDITNYLDMAIKDFELVLNNSGESEKRYNIEKVNVLLHEFKNAVGNKDRDLLYMKYKDAIEELTVI